jgi:hypothetical protein
VRIATLVAALLAGCGNGPPPEPAAPADVEPPEPPPPSCAVAVNEFLFAVEVHDPQRVRDDLVGECVDGNWTADQRRCVADATEQSGLRACSIKSRVAIVLGSSGAEIGIAECDEVLARYRRCVLPTKEAQARRDTEEALAETVAIWRERLPRRGAAAELQATCQRLARSLARQFRAADCEE